VATAQPSPVVEPVIATVSTVGNIHRDIIRKAIRDTQAAVADLVTGVPFVPIRASTGVPFEHHKT
jgi:hypothetical protein